mmetsp:Transcript_30990/g.53300  ORF Transcript_30990/g.53300 Transcript_30990/m.53300 type:complete len:339 (-) Transcript_30990:30-1046(-)|eukprot:CAMPEP_0205922008 /NCGR_PEP_ID=MMETSP1325-20131115/13784_1 /ASSEMBLY_ACC=CAM_ASM_000708 /TAXON_ID=236786 /ORGANISM="Florenciella sp., Strain RCC1007" /LENGTH=338 /DNA_ID=CAMNT_0053289953 /DNA_START=169 /DNA_END=1188 /DNA_ORIENTATION=+
MQVACPSPSAAECLGLPRGCGACELGPEADPRLATLRAVSQDGFALAGALWELKGDREVVLAAVRSNGRALIHAWPSLRADPTVVITAVAQNYEAMKWASDDLKHDRDFVLRVVSVAGHALKYAADEFKSDVEIVLAAVTPPAIDAFNAEQKHRRSFHGADGYALDHTSESLKADRDFVRQAVSRDGRALCSASPELQADREVVLDAVCQNGKALCHASLELKADPIVVVMAMAQNGDALKFANAELRRRQNGLAHWVRRQLRTHSTMVLAQIYPRHGGTAPLLGGQRALALVAAFADAPDEAFVPSLRAAGAWFTAMDAPPPRRTLMGRVSGAFWGR